MCGGVDFFRIYISMFYYERVTCILSVLCWDGSCGGVVGIIQSQVLLRMGCFIEDYWLVVYD